MKKYFHGPVLAPMDLDRFCLSKDEAQSGNKIVVYTMAGKYRATIQ